MAEKERPLFVQFGCGLSAPSGWLNFDASPTLRLQRIPVLGRLAARQTAFPKNVRFGDIVSGLPIPKNSCAALYCSHVLEHLCHADLEKALFNSYGHLRPGGIFRIVLPDLERHIREYTVGIPSERAEHFMRITLLGARTRPTTLLRRLRSAWGNSAHLWMWDYEGLKGKLVSAGFVDVRRARYKDSSLPEFKEVEEAKRWDNQLGMECRKPG